MKIDDDKVPEWALAAVDEAMEYIIKAAQQKVLGNTYVEAKLVSERCRRLAACTLAAHAPLDEAVKALERYGVHSRSCDMEHRLTRARHCDCGFDAALAKLRGAQ